MVWNFVVAALFTAGSAMYTRRQQKKAREQARDARSIEIRHTPSGGVVPTCYGRTGVEGILAFPIIANRLLTLPSSTLIGTLPTGTGSKNEYLLGQYIICAGEIERVLDVWEDNKSLRDTKLAKLVRVEWSNGGVASSMAAAFTSDRGATDLFTGTPYISIIAKFDREDPQFRDVLRPFIFLMGEKVRSVSDTGFSSSKAYTANAALGLLNQVTGGDYGPDFPDDGIDFEAASIAAPLAGAVVQGASNDLPTDYPDDLNTLFGTTYSSYEGYLQGLGLTDLEDTGYLPDQALTPTAPSQGAPTKLLRYEFNGNVPTDLEFPAMIDLFKEVMPGSQFFRSIYGKWKLVLPNPFQAAANQSILTIDNELFIGGLEIFAPDSSSKLNSMTVRYANINKDLATDSLTWPMRGGSLDATWLAADGGVRLHTDEAFEGCNDPYHAASLAATYILLSRRTRYKWTMRPTGYLLEPGQVVRVMDDYSGVDEYVYIETVRIMEDYSTECQAIHFVPSDYAWISAEKDVLAQITAIDDDLGLAQNLAVSQDYNLITITWDAASDLDADVTGWEAEVAEDGTDYKYAGRTDRNTRSVAWRLTTLDALPDFAVQIRAIGGSF